MPKVKVCGITRVEDARFLASLEVDYIGVVAYPKSPRFVPSHEREELLGACGKVRKVAVVVNPTLDEVEELLHQGFDLIQLHGEEEVTLAEAIGMDRVIKAFRVGEEKPRIDERWREAHAVLLDTYSKEAYGGTGRTFDWSLAREIIESGFRVMLAGGLTPLNVGEAVRRLRLYGVDVSSGVEIRPGVKDREKVLKFLKEVKGGESGLRYHSGKAQRR
ncbi:MAG TPA: phosphoribosylanthranilate isomerase [Aquificaceae bacterium]|nr:phosphoribosylanthranilate isomerase [Aquificaceae bacterium]